MSRTVALPDPGGKLAALLTAKGYKTISLSEASRFRAHIDAILYTEHRPDSATAEMAEGALTDDLPRAAAIDITGLSTEGAVAELEYRMQYRDWRW